MGTKMISAGEALDWMMKNPNLLIEDDTGTQWRFSSFENRLQRLVSGHWISDFFGPADVLLKFRLSIASGPTVETSATMTPGQALDWMLNNPKKHLLDHEGNIWRIRDGLFEEEANGRIVRRSSSFDPSAIASVFHIPERRLPELPNGYQWLRIGTNGKLYVARKEDGYRVQLSFSNAGDRNLFAALVEEFDTRPNGEE